MIYLCSIYLLLVFIFRPHVLKPAVGRFASLELGEREIWNNIFILIWSTSSILNCRNAHKILKNCEFNVNFTKISPTEEGDAPSPRLRPLGAFGASIFGTFDTSHFTPLNLNPASAPEHIYLQMTTNNFTFKV